MTRRGRAYTPKATHDAENRIADAYQGPQFTGPVAVEIDYFYERQEITIRDWADWTVDFGEDVVAPKWQADVDNLIKLTLDALQTRQCALVDDKQVLSIAGAKW